MESFRNIPLWIKQLRSYCNPDVSIFLVGAKCDLEENREVANQDIQYLMKEYDISYYIETSAKTGFNSTKLFLDIVKIMYDNFLAYKEKGSKSIYSKNSSSIHIYDKKQEKFSTLSKNNSNNGQTEVDKSKSSCCCRNQS